MFLFNFVLGQDVHVEGRRRTMAKQTHILRSERHYECPAPFFVRPLPKSSFSGLQVVSCKILGVKHHAAAVEWGGPVCSLCLAVAGENTSNSDRKIGHMLNMMRLKQLFRFVFITRANCTGT